MNNAPKVLIAVLIIAAAAGVGITIDRPQAAPAVAASDACLNADVDRALIEGGEDSSSVLPDEIVATLRRCEADGFALRQPAP